MHSIYLERQYLSDGNDLQKCCCCHYKGVEREECEGAIWTKKVLRYIHRWAR